MSDEKNLSDDLDDMLDDAKKGAKEFANDAKRKANEFSEDAKRSANEFSESARKSAKEFENDINTVMSDGKNIALIAHITLIGWIIALVMNNEKKNTFASFYIRQMLGLMICAFVLSFIPIVGWFLNIGLLILWILSLVSALNGEEKLTPVVGAYFQDWFKSL